MCCIVMPDFTKTCLQLPCGKSIQMHFENVKTENSRPLYSYIFVVGKFIYLLFEHINHNGASKGLGFLEIGVDMIDESEGNVA